MCDQLIDCSRHCRKSSTLSLFRSLNFTVKEPQVGTLPIETNLRSPLPEFLDPVNPSIPGSSCLPWNILRIESLWQDTQVAAATVQLVSVNVVSVSGIAAFQTEQLSVERNVLRPSSYRCGSFRIPIDQRPSPLAYPRGISSVDHGMCHGRGSYPKRDICGVIDIHDDWIDWSSTGHRTEAGSGCVRGFYQELLRALTADEGDAWRILSGHSETPSVCRSPADLAIGAGFYCERIIP